MSQTIYLDNAATTPLDPKVLEEMLPYMQNHFGNPSSTYGVGRTVRSAIETARKNVATHLNVKPTSIFFTSGGTESNNTAIASAINDLGCTHIISSVIEHHAVLYTINNYCNRTGISSSFVDLLPNGEIDHESLADQLNTQKNLGKKCLVSLMHANNEIGTLLDLKKTGELCKQHDAIFHSDCVQTVGHYPINLLESGVHMISAAGHKFHGPKGVGILYISEGLSVKPLIYGGGQERNMRAGTENTYGIIGFAKALDMAMESFDADYAYVSSLKEHMKTKLMASIDGISFNSPENSLYTVLNVCFPQVQYSSLLLAHLEMAGICVSTGSACSSGGEGSHVIKVLNRPEDSASIRFSFSKHNTFAEIDKVVAVAGAALEKVRLATA